VTNSAIWVVVANDNNAAICSSSEGISRLLRVVERKNTHGGAAEGKKEFAIRIMSELFYGAETGSYDGVVLMADQGLMNVLQVVTTPHIRKLIIAQIVDRPKSQTLLSHKVAS
jgi:hypothetical protein